MLLVDNSGQGNCMYYAYSISLMYYLRAKKKMDTTEDIFKKLALSSSEKQKLSRLLEAPPKNLFDQKEKKLIESILGPATRKLASKQTEQEFLNNPSGSSLVANAQHGLDQAFKKAFQKHDPSAHLDQLPQFDSDCTAAEIFRVSNMKRAMNAFSEKEIASAITMLKDQWKNIEEVAPACQWSPEEILHQKQAVWDEMIRQKTIAFFSENEYKHLKDYCNHLKTNYQWGTEETLLTLHRAITGERVVRDPNTDRVELAYDAEINLTIYTDGQNSWAPENPDIALNNHGNAHWTSLIPKQHCSLPVMTHKLPTFRSKFDEYGQLPSPQHDPDILQAANYGLEFCFKLELKGFKLRSLIKNNHFNHPDYTQSELFKSSEIKKAMRQFAHAEKDALIDEFNAQWCLEAKKMKEARFLKPSENIQAHQKKLLDTLIMKKTSVFLRQNNIIHEKNKLNIGGLGMQVFSGFMSVLGIAAVALAFTALNATTFGFAGLLTAGIATTLIGIGLLRKNTSSPLPKQRPAHDDDERFPAALSLPLGVF